MTAPRMLPGQEPYTEQELARLYKAIGDACEDDSGEGAE